MYTRDSRLCSLRRQAGLIQNEEGLDWKTRTRCSPSLPSLAGPGTGERQERSGHCGDGSTVRERASGRSGVAMERTVQGRAWIVRSHQQGPQRWQHDGNTWYTSGYYSSGEFSDGASERFGAWGVWRAQERSEYREKMENLAEEQAAARGWQATSWDQAGKCTKIGYLSRQGFTPSIFGNCALAVDGARTAAKCNSCVAMASSLVMKRGIHEIDLKAGNHKMRAGHVRVGLGRPSFFERPAECGVEQEEAGYHVDDRNSCSDLPDLPDYLAHDNAGGILWSGEDGQVWADGKGSHWGDGDEEHPENTYTFKDTIRLQLDLETGVLKAYKNGKSLGIMRDGIRGPWCWACELWFDADCAIILNSTERTRGA